MGPSAAGCAVREAPRSRARPLAITRAATGMPNERAGFTAASLQLVGTPEGVPYNCVVQVVRIHDPARRPANWTEIIKAGQFVAFAKDAGSGTPCDPAGRPFDDPARAACMIFDSLPEATAFCEAAVAATASLQLDVFDAGGRVHAPLLTFLHPSHAESQETHPRKLRRRRLIAWILLAAGIPLIVYAY